MLKVIIKNYLWQVFPLTVYVLSKLSSPWRWQDKWPKQVGDLYNKHNNAVQMDGNKFSFIRLL